MVIGVKHGYAPIIRYNDALESPFVAEDLRQEPMRAGARHSIPVVIRVHHGKGALAFHNRLKGIEVLFPHYPFRYVHWRVISPPFAHAVPTVVFEGAQSGFQVRTCSPQQRHYGR